MPVLKGRLARDIDNLNSHNASPGKGVTRLTFTPEYMAAWEYLIEELKKLGAEIKINRAGNLTGRLPGKAPDLPRVMVGSHIDTVLNGGRFDGVVGVAAALEAARVISEEGFPHRHPIEVVVFPEEEGSRFGTILAGSRAWAGKIDQAAFDRLKDKKGLTYAQAMAEAGLVSDDDSLLDPGSVKVMLELHIEQSVVLESKGLRIGLVEAIAGIKSFLLTVAGVANHAGGTPMDHRQDALQGAAKIISAVEEIVPHRAGPHTVATVGYLSCEPGQSNVIPGRVELTVDVRDSDPVLLDKAAADILAAARKVCSERDLTCEIEPRSDTPPIVLAPRVIDILEEKARQLGLEPLRMISGALHDSSVIAQVADGGMVFVPSKAGRSHCPEEETDLEDIELGARVLLEAVKELAA